MRTSATGGPCWAGGRPASSTVLRKARSAPLISLRRGRDRERLGSVERQRLQQRQRLDERVHAMCDLSEVVLRYRQTGSRGEGANVGGAQVRHRAATIPWLTAPRGRWRAVSPCR